MSIEFVIVLICAWIALIMSTLPNGRKAMAAAARQMYLVTPLRRITGRPGPDYKAIEHMESEMDHEGRDD